MQVEEGKGKGLKKREKSSLNSPVLPAAGSQGPCVLPRVATRGCCGQGGEAGRAVYKEGKEKKGTKP